MKRINLVFSLVSLTLLLFVFNGCDSNTDVTYSPEYKFASMVGTRWKTKTKVAIVVLGGEKYLVPPRGFDPTDPSYEYAPTSDKPRVLAAFPAGTHLRIEKLMEHDDGNRMERYVMVTLEDKTYSKKSVCLHVDFFVLNTFLAMYRSSPDFPLPKTWSVNPDLLEAAE
ncbi:MAG: hypothetical protein FWD61_20660 [Phycisphaerales bacterium]|nr:hypothetical protein [Phycisphaerales bacterium]